MLFLLLLCISTVCWYPISSLLVNGSIVVLVVLCIGVFHGLWWVFRCSSGYAYRWYILAVDLVMVLVLLVFIGTKCLSPFILYNGRNIFWCYPILLGKSLRTTVVLSKSVKRYRPN